MFFYLLYFTFRNAIQSNYLMRHFSEFFADRARGNFGFHAESIAAPK